MHGRASLLDGARASVLQATGHYREALEIRHRAAARPDILTLGAEACVLAESGEVESAEHLFVAAQDSYRDVSPFPLCWLYFQQGMMWMRTGNLTRARELLEAAHERVPRNAAVADHLGLLVATLGDRDRALGILGDAATTSDDPSAAGDLARLLQYAGRGAEAEDWRRRAAARFEELLQGIRWRSRTTRRCSGSEPARTRGAASRSLWASWTRSRRRSTTRSLCRRRSPRETRQLPVEPPPAL